VVANPKDGVAWHRVLLLIEGIGPRTAEEIVGGITGAGDVPGYLESVRSRAASTDLQALAGLVRRLVDEKLNPVDQLLEVLRYYEPLLKQRYRDDYPKRLRDLEHFTAIAARYRSLESLLTDMALEPPADSVNDVVAIDEQEGLLTLSTIHSAKGLEWHTVFIIWAVEGKFPSPYNVDDDDLEEERRLMYVAATRAKQNLYICYPVSMYDRGAGVVFAKVSRFVDGIPRSILRRVRVVEEES
jgi:DNA helicase-2/ATP-dependent DNA helicase PcrA